MDSNKRIATRAGLLPSKRSMMAFFAIGLSASTFAADEKDIQIGTLHGQMKYDIESFQVAPGSKVRLTFSNKDEMQHNLLILTPGDNKPMEVAQKAWALGPDAIKKQFVPDGPDVLFHTKVLDPQQSDTITFVAPEKEADYPYVCTLPGHAISMKGVMRVSKTAATPVKAAPVKNDGGPSLHLHVMDEPLVIRSFIDGGPSRSIAVGLPGGTNFLFDADTCYVRFGWTGMFLDVGPNVGVAPGDRGGKWSKILGDKFELGDSGFPISIGDKDAKQVVKFAGYRLRGKDVPVFYFTIDGQRVSQTVRGAAGGAGLESEFEFEKAPGRDVFFYVSPHGLQLTSSVGTWRSGRLSIPADQAKKFTVTIQRSKKPKHSDEDP